MTHSNQPADHIVGVLGLGYVGLTLGVALAKRGVQVRGIERSAYILQRLAEKRAHFLETGLNEALEDAIEAQNFTVGPDIQSAKKCSVFIITVGTPLDETGKVNLSSIRQATESIAKVLKNDDLVILRSTVRIGVTRQIVQPVLDKAQVRYHLAFCPERTLEGKALQELSSLPQIVSGLDEASTQRAETFFRILTDKIVVVSTLETAEMIKLANNTQRDLYFAFANEIAVMSDRIGISALEVIQAANLDYPRSCISLPGLVGGPCLEKDPYILAESTSGSGYHPALTLSGRKINEDLARYGVQTAQSQLFGRGLEDASAVQRVAILGLAFKGHPATSDLRGTLATPIITEIRKRFPNAEIVGFDPVTNRQEVADYLDIYQCSSLSEAAQGANLIIIQTNHADFRNMDLHSIARLMARPALIYDYWSLQGTQAFDIDQTTRYCGLGIL